MFEQELDRLTATIQARTIGSRASVTLRDILAADIPPSIHHYFRRGVEEKFQREWKERESQSRFHYDHPEVKRLKRELQSTLSLNYAFSRKEFFLAMDDGVHLMMNYLLRPQWTLLSYLFNDRPSVPSSHIVDAMNGFLEYPYIRDIIRGVIDKSALEKFTKDEFSMLLQNVDIQYIKRRSPKELAELTRPLTRYLNTGNGEAKETAPLQALLKFFEDKSLNTVALPLQEKIDTTHTEGYSHAELLQLLEEVHTRNNGFIVKEATKRVEPKKETVVLPPSNVEVAQVVERVTTIRPIEPEYNTAPTEEEVLALLKKPQSFTPPAHEEGENDFDEKEFLNSTTQREREMLSITSKKAEDAHGPLFEHMQEAVEPEPEALKDALRSEISERLQKKFVKKIFKREEALYEEALTNLNEMGTWSEAARYIGDIFIRNEIDPYSSIAVKFTDIVHSKFRK